MCHHAYRGINIKVSIQERVAPHLSIFMNNVVYLCALIPLDQKGRSLQIGRISRTIEQDSRKSVKDPYKVEKESEDIWRPRMHRERADGL